MGEENKKFMFLNNLNEYLGKENEIKYSVEDAEAAAVKGISLSEHLNNKYSKQIEKFNGELDGFDLALLSKGIVVSDDVAHGVQSSSMFKFFATNDNKTLFPEFMIRQLRQISTRPSIINYLVASTRVINGDSAKQIVLDLSDTDAGKANKEALKKRRIAEGAKIPVAELKIGEIGIKIYKYGIGVKATYEVLRRTTIDMFKKQMELVSLQSGYDEVETVIDTIIEGDGNVPAATVYKASKLNAASEKGKIDEVTLITFLVSQAPFNFDTIIVDQDIYTQVCTTLMDKNLTNAINPQVKLQFPQGLLSDLRVILSKDLKVNSAGNHQIIGLAKDYAIEKVVEAGSMINEVAKSMEDQTQMAVMTENCGFNKIDVRASAVLELA